MCYGETNYMLGCFWKLDQKEGFAYTDIACEKNYNFSGKFFFILITFDFFN